MLKLIGLIVIALGITACLLAVDIECGPLDAARCEELASEIASVVEDNNRGRRVVSISFINVDGHARVVLDDGTEVGWGERL